MKKVLAILALLGGLGAGAHAQSYGSISGWCEAGGKAAVIQGLTSTNFLQSIVPNCTVTVYLTGTQTLATIYANGTGTPLTNPFTGTSLGGWQFFAAVNQGYDVSLSGGIPPNTYPSSVTLVGQYPNANLSGAGCGISGPCSIAQGGTGGNSAAAALANLNGVSLSATSQQQLSGPITAPNISNRCIVDTLHVVDVDHAFNNCMATQVVPMENYLNGVAGAQRPAIEIDSGGVGSVDLLSTQNIGTNDPALSCTGTSPSVVCTWTPDTRCTANCQYVVIHVNLDGWGGYTTSGTTILRTGSRWIGKGPLNSTLITSTATNDAPVFTNSNDGTVNQGMTVDGFTIRASSSAVNQRGIFINLTGTLASATYASGGTSCTNGTQNVIFPVNGGLLGTITVSGGVPSGSVAVNDTGWGFYTGQSTVSGQVISCTGLSTFNITVNNPPATGEVVYLTLANLRLGTFAPTGSGSLFFPGGGLVIAGSDNFVAGIFSSFLTNVDSPRGPGSYNAGISIVGDVGQLHPYDVETDTQYPAGTNPAFYQNPDGSPCNLYAGAMNTMVPYSINFTDPVLQYGNCLAQLNGVTAATFKIGHFEGTGHNTISPAQSLTQGFLMSNHTGAANTGIKIEDNWFDGYIGYGYNALASATYASGGTACTNGVQTVTFSDTTGLGAGGPLGTIVVSGGVPTGSMTITNGGWGFTGTTAVGQVSTCTGTTTFTITTTAVPGYLVNASAGGTVSLEVSGNTCSNSAAQYSVIGHPTTALSAINVHDNPCTAPTFNVRPQVAAANSISLLSNVNNGAPFKQFNVLGTTYITNFTGAAVDGFITTVGSLSNPVTLVSSADTSAQGVTPSYTTNVDGSSNTYWTFTVGNNFQAGWTVIGKSFVACSGLNGVPLVVSGAVAGGPAAPSATQWSTYTPTGLTGSGTCSGAAYWYVQSNLGLHGAPFVQLYNSNNDTDTFKYNDTSGLFEEMGVGKRTNLNFYGTLTTSDTGVPGQDNEGQWFADTNGPSSSQESCHVYRAYAGSYGLYRSTKICGTRVPSLNQAEFSVYTSPSEAIGSEVWTLQMSCAGAVCTFPGLVIGSSGTLTGVQGTDTNALSAGTVNGTASPLCTDASGGATTNGCPGQAPQSVTFAALTNAGTGATTPACASGYTCNNQTGYATFTAGSGSATGAMVSITWSAALSSKPACTFASSSSNSIMASMEQSTSATTTTSVTLNSNALTNGSTYGFLYNCPNP